MRARLIACAHVVGPITSRYWWNGELANATEWMLVLKTTSAKAGAVAQAIVTSHPYDVPEVLVTPVVGGNPAYLAWLAAEVSDVRDVRDVSDVSEEPRAT